MLTFYIVREKSEDTTQDFPDFIYNLKDSYVFMDIVHDSPSSVTLSGQTTYKSTLEYLGSSQPEKFKSYSFCLKLTIPREDYHTFSKLRYHLNHQKDDYRIYNDYFNCYLPQDTDLISLDFGSINIKTFDVLKKYRLLPVYYSQKHRHYYAIAPTGAIHLVNPFLLEFIYDKDIPEKDIPELSYPVAPSLDLFSPMSDKGLIPVDYYEYYQRSTKIINKSHFDIDNPGRKVFVKPYIYEFRDKTGDFYTYAGPEGGSMLMMSKILRGETLDTCLKRVLNQELGIAKDYIGALVSRDIEFDRDRAGLLTPRLQVFVYVKEIINKDRALQMSQTGWVSTNGQLPKLTPHPDTVKSD
jgi:hypothetical protein